jgi:hypothetical protein
MPHAVTGQERRRLPVFAGMSIPDPPQQRAAWRPPATNIPTEFVSAATTLFEQGLADPRGCAYREIEVATGSVWSGDGGVHKTRGWVLPAKPDADQRFAVCWNGLVYPVVSVGPPTDCRTDIDSLLKADRELVDKQLAEHTARESEREREAKAKGERFTPFPPRIHRVIGSQAESYSISHETMTPIKAVILLRLGETDRAERLWEQWNIGSRDEEAKQDPYARLARDWLWTHFDRALCAHMRGDDNLALLTARTLATVQKLTEAEADKRGFIRPGEGSRPRFGDKLFDISFLKPLPALLADQERRAKQPKRPQVLEGGVDKYPEKSTRIAALVRDLENVSARQHSQPGGVSLGMDPIIHALMAKCQQ